MNNNPPNNTKNGPTLGNGKQGPNTRSNGDSAQIATKQDTITHLKTMTVLGETDRHDSAQDIASALRRYTGTIRPTINPFDLRKIMSALAMLLDALPNAENSPADQLKELTIRAIDKTKEDLKKTMREEMERMCTAAETINAKAHKNVGWQNANRHSTQKPSYSSIAAGAISADVCLVAQKAIQDRQVLLRIEGSDGTIRHKMDNLETKKMIQREIDKLDNTKKICLVQKTREKGILLEMATEGDAAWLHEAIKSGRLSQTLGITVKDRQHNVLVKFVSTTFNEDMEIQEVLKDNNINPQMVIKARWLKPKHRRSPKQRSGHMVFTFNNRDQANDICIRGLIIHSQ